MSKTSKQFFKTAEEHFLHLWKQQIIIYLYCTVIAFVISIFASYERLAYPFDSPTMQVVYWSLFGAGAFRLFVLLMVGSPKFDSEPLMNRSAKFEIFRFITANASTQKEIDEWMTRLASECGKAFRAKKKFEDSLGLDVADWLSEQTNDLRLLNEYAETCIKSFRFLRDTLNEIYPTGSFSIKDKPGDYVDLT